MSIDFSSLTLPVIAAPMFLVSGKDLVVSCCKEGIIGTFPAINTRTDDELDEMIAAVKKEIPKDAIFGVNVLIDRTSDKHRRDLNILVKHQVPLVITSYGNTRSDADKIAEIKTYGGVVYTVVVSAAHAKLALACGADGIIAIANGAGGHSGTQNPFSLIREIRDFWQGPLVLGGGITDGRGVRAALVLGADAAYIGTRFIATQESQAAQAYKDLIVKSNADDIIYTDAVVGTSASMYSFASANFFRQKLKEAGFDKQNDINPNMKAWRDIWSAGHGCSTIHDIPSVAELVKRMKEEYDL